MPQPVEPMNGGGLARLGGEGDVLQRVGVGAGEAEVHVVKLHHAAPLLVFQAGGQLRRGRVLDDRLGAQHFLDAVGGHARAGGSMMEMAVSIRKDMTICMV